MTEFIICGNNNSIYSGMYIFINNERLCKISSTTKRYKIEPGVYEFSYINRKRTTKITFEDDFLYYFKYKYSAVVNIAVVYMHIFFILLILNLSNNILFFGFLIALTIYIISIPKLKLVNKRKIQNNILINKVGRYDEDIVINGMLQVGNEVEYYHGEHKIALKSFYKTRNIRYSFKENCIYEVRREINKYIVILLTIIALISLYFSFAYSFSHIDTTFDNQMYIFIILTIYIVCLSVKLKQLSSNVIIDEIE